MDGNTGCLSFRQERSLARSAGRVPTISARSISPRDGALSAATLLRSPAEPWCRTYPCSGLKLLAKSLSRVRLSATPSTAARHGPVSMGLSRQEYWSGLPFPSTGDLPDPRIKLQSLKSSALAGSLSTTSASEWCPPPAAPIPMVSL